MFVFRIIEHMFVFVNEEWQKNNGLDKTARKTKRMDKKGKGLHVENRAKGQKHVRATSKRRKVRCSAEESVVVDRSTDERREVERRGRE